MRIWLTLLRQHLENHALAQQREHGHAWQGSRPASSRPRSEDCCLSVLFSFFRWSPEGQSFSEASQGNGRTPLGERERERESGLFERERERERVRWREGGRERKRLFKRERGRVLYAGQRERQREGERASERASEDPRTIPHGSGVSHGLRWFVGKGLDLWGTRRTHCHAAHKQPN